ncbi:MAG: NusG domain II-containing protein [Oscillospiraceae bacterium]|jgi:hypothetical protein|nr:NusG domain II-containing protein [Oscillospiraceae bacterium]
MRKHFGLTRADIILLAALLLIAGLGFARLPRVLGQNAVVRVSVDGASYAVLPLNVDTTLEIDGYSGGHNTLRIENGRVAVIAADCPDKLCMAQSEPLIVCLPNRVAITVDYE